MGVEVSYSHILTQEREVLFMHKKKFSKIPILLLMSVSLLMTTPVSTVYATQIDEDLTQEELQDLREGAAEDSSISVLPTTDAEDIEGAEPFTGEAKDAEGDEPDTPGTAANGSTADTATPEDVGNTSKDQANEIAATSANSKFQAVTDMDTSVSWEFEDTNTDTQEKDFEFSVSQDNVQRFELYYTVPDPKITLISPSGTEYKVENKTYEDGFAVEMRDMDLNDGDLLGKVIYIQNAEKGDWKIRVNISTKESCFILSQTKVPTNWTQKLTEEKQVSEKVLGYHIDPNYGKSYLQILEMQDTSVNNNFHTVKEETQKDAQNETLLEALMASGVFYIVGVVIVILIGILVWKRKEKKKDEKTKLSKAQKEYVDKIKEEYKANINNDLRSYAKTLEAEYTDDIQIDPNRDLSPKIINVKEETTKRKASYNNMKKQKEKNKVSVMPDNKTVQKTTDLPSNTPSGRRRRFS